MDPTDTDSRCNSGGRWLSWLTARADSGGEHRENQRQNTKAIRLHAVRKYGAALSGSMQPCMGCMPTKHAKTGEGSLLVRGLLRRSRCRLELDRIGLEPGAERAELARPIEDRTCGAFTHLGPAQTVELGAHLRPLTVGLT